jgi:hypothetical protein
MTRAVFAGYFKDDNSSTGSRCCDLVVAQSAVPSLWVGLTACKVAPRPHTNTDITVETYPVNPKRDYSFFSSGIVVSSARIQVS